jgi:hypothetical protein
MTLPAWPALQGAAPPPWNLTCERGIWGKIQSGPPEFRWLARSPGVAAGAWDPARALRLGAEDRPARTPGWRALGPGYLAAAYYPSRAQDAAGRGGFLERQVLAWRAFPGVPPPLAALALLPAATGLEHWVWRDRQHLGRWGDPDYALPLDPLELTGLGPDWLARTIGEGLDELGKRVTQECLRNLYAQILSGVRPACLALPDGPLGPQALAALLLPLPPQAASALSLAGWVPAEALDPEDLAGNWDFVVIATGHGWPPATVASEHLELAEHLITALLAQDPALLAERRPGTGTNLKAQRCQVSPLLTTLAQFTADPHRRLLDMAELRRILRQVTGPLAMPGGPGQHPLCRWVAQVAGDRPHWADERGWGLKVDQLRAAALCFLPHPETLSLVGLPQSPWVPALLPALASHPKRIGASLGKHGEDGLRRILHQSLGCPRAVVRMRIRAWLARWRDLDETAPALRAMIEDCLAASAIVPDSDSLGT